MTQAESRRKWVANNPEKERERQSKWYRKNKKKVKDRRNARRQYIAQRAKEWYENKVTGYLDYHFGEEKFEV